jgi:hypothetical protein
MPAGNLVVINNATQKIIATGCKNLKQAEIAIKEYLTKKFVDDDSLDEISASFSVMAFYSKYGDNGTKAYYVKRSTLIKDEIDE